MTALILFTVRIVTGSGETIDVPCEDIREATSVLDDDEQAGYDARLIRLPTLRHFLMEDN